MHCALQKTHSNNQKYSEGGQCYSSRKSLEKNHLRTSSKTQEVSSHDWNSCDQRCTAMGLLTLESDGFQKVFAPPVRHLDQQSLMGSRTQMNMDGLCHFSPSSHNAFSTNQLKPQKGPQSRPPNSIKPYATKRFTGPSIRHQSRHNIFIKKVAGSNEFSDCSSSHSSATCNGAYSAMPKRYSVIPSPDAFVDGPNTDKAVRKNCRKKTKRKGKQNKSISRDTSSTNPGVLYEHAYGTTTSDNCGYNYHGGVQGSFATLPQPKLLPDGSISKIDIDGYTTAFYCAKGLNTGSAYVHEVVIAEKNMPSTTGKHRVVITETENQTKDQGFSVLDGRVAETNHLLISCYGDMNSKSFLDVPDSLALDSVSVGSNSTDSGNAHHPIKSYGEESSSLSFSEMPGFDSREQNGSRKNLLSSVTDAYYRVESSKCGSPSNSSSTAQLLVSAKRGKKLKALPKKSSVQKMGSAANLHGRTEKENSYSVWQKVERNVIDECNCESKKVSVCSQFNTTLKQESSLQGSSDIAVSTLSGTEDSMKRQKDRVSKKLKRKNNLGLKHECNCYNGKSSHTSKATSTARRKNNMQRNNEHLDRTVQVNEQKGAKSASRYYLQEGCPKAGYQTNRGKCINSESIYSAKVFPVALEPIEDTCTTTSSVRNNSMENQDNSQQKSFNLMEHNLMNVQPPVYLPHLSGDELSQMEKDISPADYCKQNLSSGSVLQKWIPIGTKDLDLITSASSESSSLHLSDGSAGEDCTWGSNIERNGASDSHDAVSPLNLGMDFCSGNTTCADDHVQNLRNQAAWMLEHNGMLDCLTSASKEQELSPFEADSNKIAHAVNDVCRARVATEAVQMATGGPIAEFEKVLNLSSPVICRSHSLLSCQACSQDEVAGLLKCRHERPSVTLECLWKWYEKHGSYGLEVKAEDYENSKRIGVDRFSFRAYFVPFLSAVQLFKDHRSRPAVLNHEAGASGVAETCEIGETSGDSNFGHLPIFSVLIPQPHHTGAAQLVDTTWSNDVELLFEFFESDQPRQRRPLYEKIQELARGDVHSQCKMYGDPSTLVSVNVHDLHPRSWYSVAWYPIYRIPDGNLRAAFLTYHSLGHLVPSSIQSDSCGMDASVVYPAVGLQSYNAQVKESNDGKAKDCQSAVFGPLWMSECWFQLRNAAVSETPGSPSLNTSGVLKERLRTLEETASLMARAAVSKGDQTSVNRHPDYEFFVSRRG
ncbi:hypothetical protein Tsubulata_035413 [Turnera subulata]|uniref:Uncharacterized protein n=1 Tax=Turnera subulata TaxID=218843 RepID=A0A9Q0FEA5_9ROSI|nr:hypothetical protein Tsubulata_035413 [Turnera subulata]